MFGAIVTHTHTQLIVGITGSVTVLRVAYKRMLRAERAEIFCFIPLLVTFWEHTY